MVDGDASAVLAAGVVTDVGEGTDVLPAGGGDACVAGAKLICGSRAGLMVA